MDRPDFTWLDGAGFWALVAVVAAILALLLLFVLVASLLPGVVLKLVWCVAVAYALCWLARVWL